jgi:RNA polymerase-binding transcription factor DksA
MQARASRTSSRKSENERAAQNCGSQSRFFQHSDLHRGQPEVQEMRSSDVLRLERYLKFHLTEILEELGSNREADSDAESTWSAKWGSSADIVKECLLRSLEDISWALSRMREGTYGDCVACGNEIDLARLEVVPWAKFCVVCQEVSDQKRRCG